MVLLYIITVTPININTIIVVDIVIVMDIIIVYCTSLLDVNLKGIIF